LRGPAGALTAELEAAALRALADEWERLAWALFGGRLRKPSFAFTEGRSELGRWVRSHRRIDLARHLLVEQGWGVLVEVLKHEMVHQYVDEVLGLVDEPAHGPAFRKAAAERAIDGAAAGMPRAEGKTQVPLLERVAKLLALAASANEHEAQAAANAAQRLMLRHNLERVAGREPSTCTFRHLGRPTGRTTEAENVLARILGDHFFVEVIWVPVWRPLEGKRGSVLEVCGRPENVELAEHVHGFLLATAERLWGEHRRGRGIRGNRDRRAFLAGVMTGFRGRLEAQARDQAREGLVWVGDAEVERVYRARHPRIRSARVSSTAGMAAHAEGAAAGRNIVLHHAVRAEASAGTPRLLRGR